MQHHIKNILKYFRNGRFGFPVPFSIALRSSESVPTFNTGNIQDKIEETASTYLKNQQYGHQPTTPFRPKQTRKEIGLFRCKGSTVDRNMKNDIPKA